MTQIIKNSLEFLVTYQQLEPPLEQNPKYRMPQYSWAARRYQSSAGMRWQWICAGTECCCNMAMYETPHVLVWIFPTWIPLPRGSVAPFLHRSFLLQLQKAIYFNMFEVKAEGGVVRIRVWCMDWGIWACNAAREPHCYDDWCGCHFPQMARRTPSLGKKTVDGQPGHQT